LLNYYDGDQIKDMDAWERFEMHIKFGLETLKEDNSLVAQALMEGSMELVLWFLALFPLSLYITQ
jgi:hypothetical protein